MVFSSTVFLCFFLPVVLTVYYLCPVKLRNGWLFLASLVFYAWGEPVYLGIMLFSTVFDYVNGLCIEKSAGRRARKLFLIISVAGNLMILGFFKYGSFLVDTVNGILHTQMELPSFALPIGISFYTFQTMSYTIDVYRGDAKAQRNIITFGTYVAMFPQLVAGPIVRYRTIAGQLRARRETWDGFLYGVRRFLAGLFKKVMLADQAGLLWEMVRAQNPRTLSAAGAWLGALAFSFQIYFDFSGYSDMALGLGEMMGFHFQENFQHPYTAKSITDFWRRWHISLGNWFRAYVYVPLGGSRNGKLRQVRNLMVVWMLTGFWHGAGWNFILWGLYFGLLLAVEKQFLLPKIQTVPAAVLHLYTMVFVVISWMIFAFEDLSLLGSYLGAMFGLHHAGLFDSGTWYQLGSYGCLLAACLIFSTRCGSRLLQIPGRIKPAAVRYGAAFCLYAGMFFVSIVFLVGDTYHPFLYFRF